MRDLRAIARRAGRWTLGWVVIVGLTLGCAGRTPPGVILPGSRGSSPPPTGRDRGDIELGLGVVTSAVAATLVVLGAVSAAKAAYIRSYCSANPGVIIEIQPPEYQATCVDPLGFDPFRTATVSAALSFVFAVPIAAGGGMLLRKGVKMRRAYMQLQAIEARQMALRPWFGGLRGGAGLSFSLRF